MARDLHQRLKYFREHTFPRRAQEYRKLMAAGQRPSTLLVSCADSRILPHVLLEAEPGELFSVRNVGNLVPPYDDNAGYSSTAAAIEYAVLVLGVRDIVVCGHSHCGAIKALYEEPPGEARHLAQWVRLAREAALPGTRDERMLRRVEQRSVALQVERLLRYPIVRERVERGELATHGWYYVIEDGVVLVLDGDGRAFVDPAGEQAPEPFAGPV
jgi:carbonic anhydrase